MGCGSPSAVTHEHVSVVTLVADHRLVAHRGVLRLACTAHTPDIRYQALDSREEVFTVDWVVGDVALDRDTRGQVAPGPRAVSLADARGPAHHLYTWHGLGWVGAWLTWKPG